MHAVSARQTTNALRYKGYTARLEVDVAAGVVFGRVQDIKTIITFETDRLDEARRAFEEAIDDYLAACAEDRVEPERPYSGSILIRTSPDVHRLVAAAAREAGESMNAWAERTLKEAAVRTASVHVAAAA
jgi:predicted HicB family RNase H-like nuclease